MHGGSGWRGWRVWGGGGGRTLHGALFSESTPSLEPGKVYSKGQGSARRHSFCSLSPRRVRSALKCVSLSVKEGAQVYLSAPSESI